ncbi:MAG: hypothetical protein GOMPHAMPRED_004060 [Gomphillus americanus]|uniref:Uncharacterized protein n=1 Tax=Gomphillus americanus TaxID=1940652 RepID=A0A8H3FMI4_9LECA|nr:MAG: hypothetical protein GOMPHAMPRED_004060 [Gomphillus americanus]
MFRFHKPKDVITIFHKPSVAASTRALNLLKQITAQASENATEDQASDHSAQNKINRNDLDLDVSEEAPTGDQLKTIIEYLGVDKANTVVRGANSITDAIKKLEQDKNLFQHPIIVDWNNGRAVHGDNESAILKMIREGSKDL